MLAALLCGAASALAALAQRQGCGIFIILDSPITAEQALRFSALETEQAESVGFCFYSVQEGKHLYCPDTGRSAEVTAVSVLGNAGLLGADALSWASGCILDRATAQALFGAEEVGRQQAVLGAQNRQVLASVSALTPTAFVSAAGAETLNQCVLVGWDEPRIAEQFLLRYGLSGTVLNFYPILVFTKNLCLLPLWAMLICLCRTAGHRSRRLGWLAALAGIAVLGRAVIVPGDAIPNLWSDFSFWGNWLRAQRENLLSVFTWAPVDRALQMERDMVKSILCAMAGTMAAVIGGRR